jgi:hypothetical protein
MRIIEEYTEVQHDVIEVKSGVFIGDYVLRITFNDDSEKLVDFKSFLEGALHPSIRKYLDEERFQQFSIVDGNLNWNDHDLIFPIYQLYQGKV